MSLCRHTLGWWLLATLLLTRLGGAWGQWQRGSWHEFYSYRDGRGLTASDGTVYLYTPHAAHSYREADGEVQRYSTLRKLSRGGIVTVFSVPKAQQLLVSYSDGTVELVGEGASTCLGTLRENVELGVEQPIHQFALQGETLLGINRGQLYALSGRTLQIEGQWRVWRSDLSESLTLQALATRGEKLYVGTSDGVYTPKDPLSSTRAFTQLGDLGGEIVGLAGNESDGSLLAIRLEGSGYEAWRHADGKWEKLLSRIDTPPLSVTPASGQYLLCDGNKIFSLNPEGAVSVLWDDETTPSDLRIAPQEAMIRQDGALYVASRGKGLLLLQGETVQMLSPESPSFTSVYRILHHDGALYISGGDPAGPAGALGNPFAVYSSSSTGQTEYSLPYVHNALAMWADTPPSGDLLVGSGDGGLLRFGDGKLQQQYLDSNSPLRPSPYTGAICVNGGITTPDGTWWLHNPGNDTPLLTRSAQGQWRGYRMPLSTGGNPVSFCISPSGILWMWCAGTSTVARIDPSVFAQSKGANGCTVHTVFNSTNHHASLVNHLCVDGRGTLWIAAHNGLLSHQHPESVAHGDPLSASPITFSDPHDHELAAYMLGLIPVTTVLVDHGDRLWVGTLNAGLYHVDPQNESVLSKYTPANSPLPSLRILDLALSGDRGELYVGTDMGVVSLLVDTQTPAANYDQVSIYPNPIRPEYDGPVYIDGLMQASDIKITDAAGRLVRTLKSSGGRAVWDMRNGLGHRVSTGVYLVFCTNQDGSQTEAGCMAIIR